MQTSAMNCSLLLNANKSEKSPESWIFLAASAISFNSFFIALCQSNISSIGQDTMELVWAAFSSICFLLTVLENSHAQFPCSVCLINALAPESWHLTLRLSLQLFCISDTFTPSIQANTTFTSAKIKLVWFSHKTIQNDMPPRGALTCWRSFSSGIILHKHFRMSWRSSDDIEEESHGRNFAIMLTGMLQRNCHTNVACSSNENFSISKGKTCQNTNKRVRSKVTSNLAYLFFYKYFKLSILSSIWMAGEVWRVV